MTQIQSAGRHIVIRDTVLIVIPWCIRRCGFAEAKVIVVERLSGVDCGLLTKVFIECETLRIGIMRRFCDHQFEECFVDDHRLAWALSVPYRRPKLRKLLLIVIMEQGHV